MAIHWRPMRPEDLSKCVSLVATHPLIGPRYGRAIQHLQPAWSKLFSCDAKCLTVFEQQEGSRMTIAAIGVSVIVGDDFVRELKIPPLRWVGPTLAMRLANSDSPVLSDRQLRESNSREGLNLLVWEGCFRPEFDGNPGAHRTMINSFIEQHRGFLWKEIIGAQVESPGRLEWHINSGGFMWDPVHTRYAGLSGLDPKAIVRKPHLVGVTRDMEVGRNDSWRGGGSWIGSLFDYSPPSLGFNHSEQKLLITALTGEGTDRELAATLGVSLHTVKKMWLSIYSRVAGRQLWIIPDDARAETGASGRGGEKRRHLLAYVREHPEELRPVSRRLLAQSFRKNLARTT